MTDIALDEKALAETQVEFDNVPPGLVEAIVAAWNRRASPSQVAPANPAQGATDGTPSLDMPLLDRLETASAIVANDDLTPPMTSNRSRRVFVTETIIEARAALTAAIGADGQAVAVAWQVRDNPDESDEDSRAFDVLLPSGEWRTCIAVGPSDARDCIRDEWLKERSTQSEYLPPIDYAHPAPRGQAVAVKPLEWTRLERNGVHQEHWTAKTGLHQYADYEVYAQGAGVYRADFDSSRIGSGFSSAEAAKAAAQADYESRILSALGHPHPLPLKEEVERVLREAGCTSPDGTFIHASTRNVVEALSRLRARVQEGWRDDCLETIEHELIDGLEVEITLGEQEYTFNHRQLARRILSALYPASPSVSEGGSRS